MFARASVSEIQRAFGGSSVEVEGGLESLRQTAGAPPAIQHDEHTGGNAHAQKIEKRHLLMLSSDRLGDEQALESFKEADGVHRLQPVGAVVGGELMVAHDTFKN